MRTIMASDNAWRVGVRKFTPTYGLFLFYFVRLPRHWVLAPSPCGGGLGVRGLQPAMAVVLAPSPCGGGLGWG